MKITDKYGLNTDWALKLLHNGVINYKSLLVGSIDPAAEVIISRAKRSTIYVQIGLKSNGAPKGIRIPVPSLKGWCPRPLDDGGTISRIDGQGSQPGRFRKTKHYIHILHCLSSSALDQVIYTAYYHHPARLLMNDGVKQA